jgi:excisionase family DNA binding protein
MAEQVLFSILDVARMLGVGRSTVYLLIARDELPVVHVGRRTLVHVDSVHEYVSRLRAEAAAD